MIRKELIPALRKEAEEQARKILGNNKLKKGNLESKHNTSKKHKSALHSLFNPKDIDHCINNGIDMWYLYEEMGSKYNGDREVIDRKKYYQCTGKPRGRPKQNNNE